MMTDADKSELVDLVKAGIAERKADGYGADMVNMGMMSVAHDLILFDAKIELFAHNHGKRETTRVIVDFLRANGV